MPTANPKPIASKTAVSKKLPANAKPATKPASRLIGKISAKPAAKAAKPTKPAKPPKPKKEKLVRDSFTIPKAEYVVLDALKQRAAKLGAPAKKSELLRAGIKALAAMADAALATALKNVPAIKTGRPSKT